jgi:TRAP-type C4-dicarboxylate transport system substrate-binding protein
MGADKLDRLSEAERTALLKAFDEFVPQIEARSAEEVDQELTEVRRARGTCRRSDYGAATNAATTSGAMGLPSPVTKS